MNKTPEIGMGVTYCIGSDRYPYTIVGMSPSKKTLYVTEDSYRVVSGSFYTGDAKVEFEQHLDAAQTEISLRKDGRYRQVGQGKGSGIFVIGERDGYQDPSF